MPRPDRIVLPGRAAGPANTEWLPHVRGVRDRNTGRDVPGEVFHVEPDIIGFYTVGPDGEPEHLANGDRRMQFRHGDFEILWQDDAPEDLP